MGKKLIIKGADFSQNAIAISGNFTFVPTGRDWSSRTTYAKDNNTMLLIINGTGVSGVGTSSLFNVIAYKTEEDMLHPTSQTETVVMYRITRSQITSEITDVQELEIPSGYPYISLSTKMGSGKLTVEYSYYKQE